VVEGLQDPELRSGQIVLRNLTGHGSRESDVASGQCDPEAESVLLLIGPGLDGRLVHPAFCRHVFRQSLSPFVETLLTRGIYPA
jgi:hypothetical protein